MNDPRLEPLVAYLRQNAGVYDLEALQAQLLQSGYDRETVARAVIAFRQEQAGAPAAEAAASRGNLWIFGLLITALNGGVASLIALQALHGKSDAAVNAVLGTFALVAVEVVAGLGMLFVKRVRRQGVIVLWGASFSIGLVLLCGIGFVGYCILHI